MMEANQKWVPFQIIGIYSSITPGATGYYRILVNGRQIKYLGVISPSSKHPNLIPDANGSILSRKEVPEGDWNVALLSSLPDGRYRVASLVQEAPTPCIRDRSWWAQRVDWTELENKRWAPQEMQCKPDPSRTIVCKNPYVTGEDAVLHFDWDPETCARPEHISNVYKHIHELDIAPRFLALVRENFNGRVLGCLVEKIRGGRPATAHDNDIRACLRTLKKLHRSDFLFGGDIGVDSFIMRADGTAVIHDLSACKWQPYGESLVSRDMEINALMNRIAAGVKFTSPITSATEYLATEMIKRKNVARVYRKHIEQALGNNALTVECSTTYAGRHFLSDFKLVYCPMVPLTEERHEDNAESVSMESVDVKSHDTGEEELRRLVKPALGQVHRNEPPRRRTEAAARRSRRSGLLRRLTDMLRHGSRSRR